MFLPGSEENQFSTDSMALLFHSKRRVVCTFSLLMGLAQLPIKSMPFGHISRFQQDQGSLYILVAKMV